jgi:hypothetical protein
MTPASATPSNNGTWRERLKVHPAADVFPLLTTTELRELADDIARKGMNEGVTLYTDPATFESVLLDGRNRLDALELLGETVFNTGGWLKDSLCGTRISSGGAVDPAAYVISKNIRRRHLTKRQQADLIVAAVKAADTGRAKAAQPVKRRNARGQLQGQQSKDPVKTQVLELAADAGVGERTATQALVDAEPERKRRTSTSTRAKTATRRRAAPTVEKRPASDVQEALFVALDKMAVALAGTGHGDVTVKTTVTFADGTQIETTARKAAPAA